MPNLVRKIAATAVALLIASVGSAQATLSITPNPLTQGGNADITYTDPSRANTTVNIVISGGMPPVQQTVSIRLDATGKGKATWRVPAWSVATFSAPGVDPQTVQIQ